MTVSLTAADPTRILAGPPHRIRGRRSQDLAKLASLVDAPDFRILLQAKIGLEEAGALIATVQDVAEEAEALFSATDYAPIAGVLVRRDEPDIEVVATLDTIPAHARIAGAELQPDGRLQLHYVGETLVQWNDQATVRTRNGGREFVDIRGDIVPETDIALRLADGEILAPALRFTSVLAE